MSEKSAYAATAKKRISTKQMVIVSMFAALSYILMLLKLPIAYLGFLELEFSDIPAFVAGLAYGPAAAVLIELIKNLVKALINTYTGGIGEMANFIIISGYMVPVCFLFKKYKKGKKLILAFAAGTIGMTIVGALANYFVMIPLYAKIFGGLDGILTGASKTVPAIHSLASLIVLGISPFNIFKGIMISFIGYYVYKYIIRYIR